MSSETNYAVTAKLDTLIRLTQEQTKATVQLSRLMSRLFHRMATNAYPVHIHDEDVPYEEVMDALKNAVQKDPYTGGTVVSGEGVRTNVDEEGVGYLRYPMPDGSYVIVKTGRAAEVVGLAYERGDSREVVWEKKDAG